MSRRKTIILLTGILLLFFCAACSNDANQDEPIEDLVDEVTFKATVEDNKNGLMVVPLDEESESKSSNLIYVGTNDAKLLDVEGNEIELADFKIGMTVEIVYDGIIMESYPGQIRSFLVQIVHEEH